MIRTQSKWRRIWLSFALDSKAGFPSSSFLATAFPAMPVPFSGYPHLLSAIGPSLLHTTLTILLDRGDLCAFALSLGLLGAPPAETSVSAKG